MKTRTLIAGGVLAVATVIGGNEAVVQHERTVAVAEHHKSPRFEIGERKTGEEIKSFRTANSEAFKADSAVVITKDGKAVKRARYTTRVYAGQHFWKDADADTLRPLDLTVREISILARLNPWRTHDKYVDAGPYTARWMNDTPGNFRMEAGGLAIEYRAIYDPAGVTIATEPIPNGIKETLTLADKNAAHVLEWEVDTAEMFVAGKDGGFGIQPRTGLDAILCIEPPKAWDAAGKPVTVTASVRGDTLSFRVDVLPGQEYPVTVDPTTVYLSKTGTTGSAGTKSDATYTVARDATTSDSMAGTLSAGQDSSVSGYSVSRLWIAFPLKGSQIATVSACSLKVYGLDDGSTTDFRLCVFGANSARPTLTTADFDQFNGWQSGAVHNGITLNAAFSTSSFSVGAWNSLIFLGAGRDSVVNAKDDTLWVAVVSHKDSSRTAPSAGNSEYISISPVGGGYAPYLSMTSDVEDSSATAVSITSVAGYPESLVVTFTDRAYSETGYALVNAVGEARVGGKDSIGAVSGFGGTGTIRMGGRLPNTSYTWKVKNLGGSGDGLLSVADSCYTRANVPGKSTVSFPADSLLKFILKKNNYFQKEVTVDPTKIDAQLDSFPVLVKLTSSNFTFAKSANDGRDVHFVLSDGTELKFDRERHDKPNSLAEYWVKIPTLPDGAFSFYIIYGDSNRTDSANRTAVWDGNFKMVQHLADSTTSRTADATSNGNFGTKLAANEPIEAAGVIGKGQDFDGSDDYINVGTSDDLSAATSFTVSGWFQTNWTEGAETVPFRKVTNYYLVKYANNTVGMAVAGLTPGSKSVPALSGAGYQNIVGVYNSAVNSIKIYVNGAYIDSSANTGTATATSGAIGYIGNYLPSVDHWNGVIDEVRVSNTVRSAAWIKAEYYSGVDSLLTYGAESYSDLAGNPDYTEYAIQDSITEKYVDFISGAVDTFATAAEWRTYANWGGANGDTVAVGVGKKYTVRAKARSGQ